MKLHYINLLIKYVYFSCDTSSTFKKKYFEDYKPEYQNNVNVLDELAKS